MAALNRTLFNAALYHLNGHYDLNSSHNKS